MLSAAKHTSLAYHQPGLFQSEGSVDFPPNSIDTFDSLTALRKETPVSVLQEILDRFERLETLLSDRPDLAAEVRAIRLLFESDRRRWVGTVEAQKLLGLQSVNTVKAWAKRGLLRSVRLPNGRLHISLEDVLRERQAREAFAAFPSNDEVTAEERELSKHPLRPDLEAIVQELVGRSRASASASESLVGG
jgi:hypothetical protein